MRDTKTNSGEDRESGDVWLTLISISIPFQVSNKSQIGITVALQDVSKQQELENTAILWQKGE